MKILVVLTIIAANAFSAFAQEKDTVPASSKLDSIYNLQKKMYNETKNEPLTNRRFGLEINPFRLLAMKDWQTFSGTVSLFSVNRHAEIAFPIYFQNRHSSGDLMDFTADCHFRYFMGNTQNGFYLSGFVRYAYLYGKVGDIFLLNLNTSQYIDGEANKLGVGFGLGYRIFSYNHLYWGASLSFGRYMLGKSGQFSNSIPLFHDDWEYIFDIELFKFGWAF
jgi:hypothetical protein